MIVYATKLTIRKAAIGLAVLGGIIWGIAALAPHAAQTVAAQFGDDSISQKLTDNAERVKYLQEFGWTVKDTPVVQMEVQIPKEFDASYQTYNAVQQRQGLDLTRFRGKRATLYTYEVTNYPSKEQGVTASLLLYKNRVIGADVSSANANGFLHGLTERPTATSTAQTPAKQTPSTAGGTAQKSAATQSPQTSSAAPKQPAESTPQSSSETAPAE